MDNTTNTRLKRWRLILGKDAESALNRDGGGILSSEEDRMDLALSMIYDNTGGSLGAGAAKGAGNEKSRPNLAKWLVDVRTFFPPNIVSIIQADAIERKGLKQLLFEPETLKNVTPDINMVGTLLALKGQIPAKAKDAARELVRAVVDDIMRRLEQSLKKAVRGALNKKNHSPIASLPGADWKRTISRNLKNYNIERQRLIPEKIYFFERQKKNKDWNVILDIDQSGSMADSIIYSSVMGSIFASMPSLETHIIAFDTEVTDLSEAAAGDPVDLLFGIQMGGGTDINKSVNYCRNLINIPSKTLFILISDLYEGGVEAQLLRQLEEMHESGVKCMILLALADSGTPSYDAALAKKAAALGIPSFACTPDRLPELVAGAIKGEDLFKLGEHISKSSQKTL